MTFELPVWARNVPVSDDAEWDITFFIRKDVYFGDPNNLKDNEKYTESLNYVKYPLIDGRRVSSKDILKNPDELIRHYRNLIEVAKKHSLPFDRSYSFTMSLSLLKQHTRIMSFIDLYQSLPEILVLMGRILTNTKDNGCFTDCDECWSMYIYRDGDNLVFKQSDAVIEEEEKNIFIVSMDKEKVREQFREAILRTEEILKLIKESIGLDLFNGFGMYSTKNWSDIETK